MGIKCDANMVSDQEADVDFDIIPNANDTFTVKYIPPAAGKLTVKVLFTDKVGACTYMYTNTQTHTEFMNKLIKISTLNLKIKLN